MDGQKAQLEIEKYVEEIIMSKTVLVESVNLRKSGNSQIQVRESS